MTAIILAAGRGSRMLGLTDEKPKCMTILEGQALLDWQLQALRRAGHSNVTVIGGYRNELLGGDYNVMINQRWSDTNMVRSLCVADELLKGETCIVSYSDIVYSPDHVEKLSQETGDIALTYDVAWKSLWSLRFANPLDDAETFVVADGKVLEIGGKTTDIDSIQGQFMGLLKFTPAGWRHVSGVLAGFESDALDKLDMTSLISALLSRNIPVSAVPVNGGWCEVDSEDDLNAYQRQLKSNQDWLHDWRRDTAA